MQVGPGFTFGSLTIVADGVDESYVAMTGVVVEGAVIATGAALGLRVRNSTMLTFNGSVGIGTIDLDTVNVGISIRARVDTGDIVVGPTGISEVDLSWDQACGYVCLPDGQFVDDTSCYYNGTCADANCSATTTQVPASPTLFNETNSSVVIDNLFEERLCLSRICTARQIVALQRGSVGKRITMDARTIEGSIYLYDPQDCVAIGTCLPAESNGIFSGTNGSAAARNTSAPKIIQLSDGLQRQFSLQLANRGEFDDGLYPVALRSFQPNTLWLLTDRQVR